jgi:hypothetical protein
MVEQPLQVGTPCVVASSSSRGPHGVVFEDDGDTGYFYALDHRRADRPIVDALQVYNASAVIGRDRPRTLRIVWSEDGQKAALFIDGDAYAVFDFAAQRGYCRTNFPRRAPHGRSTTTPGTTGCCNGSRRPQSNFARQPPGPCGMWSARG